MHPAFYLDQANKALSLNVRLGPWIHVGSVIQHFSAARLGETLATRGRVRSVFEKKGKEFVELDLLISAGDRPVAQVFHTAIYRLPIPDVSRNPPLVEGKIELLLDSPSQPLLICAFRV